MRRKGVGLENYLYQAARFKSYDYDIMEVFRRSLVERFIGIFRKA
jgi:hypothetical protein